MSVTDIPQPRRVRPSDLCVTTRTAQESNALRYQYAPRKYMVNGEPTPEGIVCRKTEDRPNGPYIETIFTEKIRIDVLETTFTSQGLEFYCKVQPLEGGDATSGWYRDYSFHRLVRGL